MIRKILVSVVIVGFIGLAAIQGPFSTLLMGDIYTQGEVVERHVETEITDIDDYSKKFYWRWQVTENGSALDESNWIEYQETGTDIENLYEDQGLSMNPAYSGSIAKKSTWFIFGWEGTGNREDVNENYYRYFHENDQEKALMDEDFWVDGNAQFGTYSDPEESISTHYFRVTAGTSSEAKEMVGRNLERIEISVAAADDGYYHHPADKNKVNVQVENNTIDVKNVTWKSSNIISIDTANYTFESGDELKLEFDGVDPAGRATASFKEKFMIKVSSDGSMQSADFQVSRNTGLIDKPTFFMVYDEKIKDFEFNDVYRYERNGTRTNMTDHLKLCNGNLTTSEMTADNTNCGYSTASGVKGDNVLMFRFKNKNAYDAYKMEHYRFDYEIQLPRGQKADGMKMIAGKDGQYDGTINLMEKYYEQRVQYPLIGNGIEAERSFDRNFDSEGIYKYKVQIANDNFEVISNDTYKFQVVAPGDKPSPMNELFDYFGTVLSVLW